MSNFKLLVKIKYHVKLHKLEHKGIVIHHQLLEGNFVQEDGMSCSYSYILMNKVNQVIINLIK